jgi:hypothetical protein
MATTGEVRRQSRPPKFVEPVAPRTQSVPECTLEVEGRRGKLRIHDQHYHLRFPDIDDAAAAS